MAAHKERQDERKGSKNHGVVIVAVFASEIWMSSFLSFAFVVAALLVVVAAADG